jgi:hypothetical protein
MVRFAVEIPEELNKEFRIKVIQRYGSEKGSVTKATTEAIRLWIKEMEPAPRKK